MKALSTYKGNQKPKENKNMTNCKTCTGAIAKDAIVCPHCGSTSNLVEIGQEVVKEIAKQEIKFYIYSTIMILVTIFIIFKI